MPNNDSQTQSTNFIQFCKELRAMGAVVVHGFGFAATFEPSSPSRPAAESPKDRAAG